MALVMQLEEDFVSVIKDKGMKQVTGAGSNILDKGIDWLFRKVGFSSGGGSSTGEPVNYSKLLVLATKAGGILSQHLLGKTPADAQTLSLLLEFAKKCRDLVLTEPSCSSAATHKDAQTVLSKYKDDKKFLSSKSAQDLSYKFAGNVFRAYLQGCTPSSEASKIVNKIWGEIVPSSDVIKVAASAAAGSATGTDMAKKAGYAKISKWWMYGGLAAITAIGGFVAFKVMK